MNIEQLNLQFSNEAVCRNFFEAARWPNGRICPHCSFNISYKINIIGVRQPTAWRMGHATRQMMDQSRSDAGLLQGIVELDKQYVGGVPKSKPDVVHKRGKGTSKQ